MCFLFQFVKFMKTHALKFNEFVYHQIMRVRLILEQYLVPENIQEGMGINWPNFPDGRREYKAAIIFQWVITLVDFSNA